MPLYITPSNVFVEIPEGQKVPEGWRHLPLGMSDERLKELNLASNLNLAGK